MKKIFLLCALSIAWQQCSANTPLDRYKEYLDKGTYESFSLLPQSQWPLSRYHTFKFAFEHFAKNNGRIVVELGTTRSFTHGGLPGCNQDDTRHWTPNSPENWDWGAGSFTRMAAECLYHLKPKIYTVDIAHEHITRCKTITKDFQDIMNYYVCSSLDFLAAVPAKSIDLLYLDTGNMTPINQTALLQLAEATLIVERNVLSDNGIILIDDVKNQTPKGFGEIDNLAKSKYSIPYLLYHGYEIIVDGYQVIMRRKKQS